MFFNKIREGGGPKAPQTSASRDHPRDLFGGILEKLEINEKSMFFNEIQEGGLRNPRSLGPRPGHFRGNLRKARKTFKD